MRILISLLLILSALPALAQNRLALVIGNDNYAEVPVLDKAVADARAVADTLRGLGFETIEGIDLDRRETNRRISNFTARLQPGDTAFVFYAGHGVEIDGENYLLPTDIVAPKSGESDFVKSESIALSDLLDRVRATGASTAIAAMPNILMNTSRRWSASSTTKRLLKNVRLVQSSQTGVKSAQNARKPPALTWLASASPSWMIVATKIRS